MQTGGVTAVIPMKPLELCKLRLAPILDASRRALLTLWMLDRVVEAVLGTHDLAGAAILGGDVPIRRLAERRGLSWQADASRGLNRALDLYYETSIANGSAGMLFLAGDLPALQADDVSRMLDALDGVDLVLAPGARGGTNAIVVRRDRPFAFHLGAHSFRRHREQAEARGLKWREFESPAIHADIDLPSDLDWLEREQPDLWLQAETVSLEYQC
ncbi:MAG TPA: 2-phospho-L-lactate guanylyltransferase [Dehalococcoidia bacterium]|nr:2-phospho-L-lactate guanylyltransferase [Dehalococcoidia bacterium]